MIRSFAAVALVLTVATAPAAQTKVPIFAGRWDIVAPPDEWDAQRLDIAQTTSVLTLSASGGLGGQLQGSRTFRLDNAETKVERRDAQGRPSVNTSRVEWIGESLAITTTTEGQWNFKTFEAYSFDIDGRLVVVRIETPKQKGSMITKRLVYSRSTVR